MHLLEPFFLVIACLLLAACAKENSMEIVATAYTSSSGETDEHPTLAAWGHTLEPDMKVIAVSRDLEEFGLTKGTRVTIEELPGEYLVLDKMHSRWEQKIDIYMGNDTEAAIEWGEREVSIQWD